MSIIAILFDVGVAYIIIVSSNKWRRKKWIKIVKKTRYFGIIDDLPLVKYILFRDFTLISKKKKKMFTSY